jgi:hypothetical protein
MQAKKKLATIIHKDCIGDWLKRAASTSDVPSNGEV